jgi:DNA-binding SARP family transcriptional activator
MSCSVRIELFGSLQVRCHGRVPVRIHTGRPGALLAYLACHRGREVGREAMMEVLWPEVDPTAGRNRLKQTLSVLRRCLDAGSDNGHGPDHRPGHGPGGDGPSRFLIADRDFLYLDATAVETDVNAFETELELAGKAATTAGQLEHLQRAVRLCRSELLAGYYDDWVLAERDRLNARAAGALCRLALGLAEVGDRANAVEHARRWVEVDPEDEKAHATLISLYLLAGRRPEARLAYRAYVRVLDEMGERPSPVMEKHAKRIEA